MRKIVINKCFGGFSVSYEVRRRLREMENEFASKADEADKGLRDIPRDDPQLVSLVEELGNKAWGYLAELGVIEIPDHVEWEIEEYDGVERVAEKHETWR